MEPKVKIKFSKNIGKRKIGEASYLFLLTTSWVIIAFYNLHKIPANYWQYRDDGVITLSHALNFIDFGIVGTSPSGPSVEGFSSPLQFVLAAGFFKIFTADYKIYLDVFVILNYAIHSFLVGKIFLKLFKVSLRAKEIYFIVFCSHLTFGLILVNLYSYFAWSISGLENPLIVSTGLVIINILLDKNLNKKNYINILSASVVLLALVRIEFSILIVIILVTIFLSTLNSSVHKNWKSLLFNLTLRIVGPIFIFHLLRLMYFGKIYPNTAYVQNKTLSFSDSLILLLFIFEILIVYYMKNSNKVSSDIYKNIIKVTISALVTILIIVSIGYPLSIIVLGIYLFSRIVIESNRPNFDFPFILFGFIYFFIAQFIIFGPARLDPIRIIVNLSPFLLLLIYYVMFRTIRKILSLSIIPPLVKLKETPVFIFTLILLSIASVLVFTRFNKPFDLPWSISPSESKILHVASEILKPLQTDEIILSVANPDLGKLSFSKQVNVIDLGYIGSPIVKKLTLDGADKLLLYLNNIARPDIVQLHGGWSCLYSEWVNSDEFKQSYYPVITPPSGVKELTNTKCAFNSEYMIWVRNDLSKELNLSRNFLKSQKILKLIEEEVDKCVLESDIIFRCEYLVRSLFRIRPFLVENYDLQELTKALSTSPTYLIDSALLLNKRNLDTLVMQELDSINTK
jgi:hypothetical protein